jgi:hypothetical protein
LGVFRQPSPSATLAITAPVALAGGGGSPVASKGRQRVHVGAKADDAGRLPARAETQSTPKTRHPTKTRHWPPPSRSLEHTPLLLRMIFQFISRVLRDDGLPNPVAQIVSHMDFEIYRPFRPTLSASEPSASPTHEDGGDLFDRFVDNDLVSFKGQRDVENLEPSEAAIFPFLLLDANFAGKVQATYYRGDLSSFIARDIKRILGADDD